MSARKPDGRTPGAALRPLRHARFPAASRVRGEVPWRPESSNAEAAKVAASISSAVRCLPGRDEDAAGHEPGDHPDFPGDVAVARPSAIAVARQDGHEERRPGPQEGAVEQW